MTDIAAARALADNAKLIARMIELGCPSSSPDRDALTIRRLANAYEATCAALEAAQGQVAAMGETLDEVDAGLQWWLESYGDQSGHIVGLLAQVRATHAQPVPDGGAAT